MTLIGFSVPDSYMCSPVPSICLWMTKSHSSLWLNNIHIYIYIYIYIYHIFLINSSVVGNLGCFYSLAITNNVTINMGVQVSLLYPHLHSFGHRPRSDIAGSSGGSTFSFLRSLCTPSCFL
jgi:hypothetical protein